MESFFDPDTILEISAVPELDGAGSPSAIKAHVMALSSATVWECRTTGNDLNGGGFRAGASGTDYSQQDSPILILTDCNASGTTNLNSVAGGFTTAMIGNLIQLSGGTLTAGLYEIKAVTNAQNITLDRTCGTGSGTTGRVGGALASLSKLSTVFVGSNKAFVQGGLYATSATITFSTSVTPSNSVPPSRIVGYSATRGDNGLFNLQLQSGTAVTVLNFTGSGWIVEGASIDCNSQVSSTGISLANPYSDCRRCRVANFTSTGISAIAGDSAISDCEVTGGNTGAVAISSSSANVKILRNYIHDNLGVGIAATSDGVVAWNVVANNSGSTSDGIRIGYATVAMFNTVHNNGRHGISKIDNSLINGQVRNNILSLNGGYGYNGGAGSGLPADPRYDGNAYYNNALGARTNCDDLSGINGINPYINVLDVILTSNPFTNPASGDWSLNNLSGGGSSCRAAGTPGLLMGSTRAGFVDFGALQHQDSAVGMTTFIEG